MHAFVDRRFNLIPCAVTKAIDAARHVRSRYPDQRAHVLNGDRSDLRIKALLTRVLVLRFRIDNEVRDPCIHVSSRQLWVVLEQHDIQGQLARTLPRLAFG